MDLDKVKGFLELHIMPDKSRHTCKRKIEGLSEWKKKTQGDIFPQKPKQNTKRGFFNSPIFATLKTISTCNNIILDWHSSPSIKY